MEEIILKIQEVRQLNQDTVHIVLERGGFEFQAGQFVMLSIGDNKPRAFSIASSPKEDTLEFCVKAVGENSRALTQAKAGDEVKIKGPMGHFTLKEAQKYIFIGVGTGVAPFRSMIRSLQGKDVCLLFGARYKEGILYKEEFEALAQNNEHFQYMITLSQEKGYLEGHVQDHIDKLDIDKAEVYICGMSKMVSAVQEALLTKGLNKEQIHTERYG